MPSIAVAQFAEHSQARVLSVAATRYRWWTWRSNSYEERVDASTSRRCWSAIDCGSRSRAGCRSTRRRSRRRSSPNACAGAPIRRRSTSRRGPAASRASYGLPRPSSVRWVDNMRQRWGSCTPGGRRDPGLVAARGVPVVGARLRARPRARAPRRAEPRPGARRARRPVPARRAGPGLPDRDRPRSRRRRRRPAAPRGRRSPLTGPAPARIEFRRAVSQEAAERGRRDRARPPPALVVLLEAHRHRDPAVHRDLILIVAEHARRRAEVELPVLGDPRGRVGGLARPQVPRVELHALRRHRRPRHLPHRRDRQARRRDPDGAHQQHQLPPGPLRADHRRGRSRHRVGGQGRPVALRRRVAPRRRAAGAVPPDGGEREEARELGHTPAAAPVSRPRRPRPQRSRSSCTSSPTCATEA